MVVARFGNPAEAELARAVLASHGIDAVLCGEDTAITLSYIGPALGGVELRARPEDAEAAAGILQNVRMGRKRAETRLRRCPRCGTAVGYAFDVCWNCGGSTQHAEEIAAEPEWPERPAALEAAAEPVEATATRCLRLAAWGTLLPPLGVVAVWELIRDALADPRRVLSNWRSYATLALVFVTLAGWLLAMRD